MWAHAVRGGDGSPTQSEGDPATHSASVGALKRLPPVITHQMLEKHFRGDERFDADVARLELPGNRYLIFAAQDNLYGGKNEVWKDERARCVWTGSLPPSSATFYNFSPTCTPTGSTSTRALPQGGPVVVYLAGHPVLVEVLTHFKRVPSEFTSAATYYMGVGSRLEDTAVKHYIEHFCPGVAVEEYLRTIPYSPGSSRRQGGSPDGLLLVPQADGTVRRVSMEIKCAAACQNCTCKRRRTELARKLARAVQAQDDDFTALYESYCNASTCGWPVRTSSSGTSRYISRLDGCGRFKLRASDRLTARPEDIYGYLAGNVRPTDLVYCTDDTHKSPHKFFKPYSPTQVMLEMFHQRCTQGRMICFGYNASGPVMNAFGVRFHMQCLVAGVVFMETERRLAAYLGHVANTVGDPARPQLSPGRFSRETAPRRRLPQTLLQAPPERRADDTHERPRLSRRQQQRQGAVRLLLQKEWNNLDPVSQKILGNGWSGFG